MREAIEKTIKDVVNRELEKKGYREDAQNPDFCIAFRHFPRCGSFAHKLDGRWFSYIILHELIPWKSIQLN
jgi:hypothetical protein